jgi:hypothetical protein
MCIFSLSGIFTIACGSNSPSTTKCSECFSLRISKIPLTTTPERTIYLFPSNRKKRKKMKIKTNNEEYL